MKFEHWNIAEDLFSEDPSHVLAAAKVHKCQIGVAQLTKLHKAPKASGKARLLVLTGIWDENTSRVQLALHTCKQFGSNFKVTKTFPLSNLVKMEVYQGEPGLLTNIQVLELTWAAGTTETHLVVQTPDEDLLLQILAPLWHFAQKYPASEARQLGLITYPHNTVSLVVQLEAWAANHLDPEVERKLTSPMCGGAVEVEGEDGKDEGQVSLVSAKEERDLQVLLDRFSMEVGDIEDFQQRLQDELAALEAANVHAILASGPSVERVRRTLNDALGLLEDLNENLATFDTKLLVMREDITAIEARNNKLELQTRNNGKLLGALERLLERLQLAPQEERALRTMAFSQDNLEEMVKAGWELYDHLEALSEADPHGDGAVGISPALANMAAVADQRSKFAILARVFTQRASAFIGEELQHLTDRVMPAAAAHVRHGPTKPALPDHTALHEGTQNLSSLLHVVRSLQPNVLDKLGERYTSAFNVLLRRELRLYTSELRRAVTASAAHLPPEPTLLKGVRKEDVKAAHSFSGLQNLGSQQHLGERPLGSLSSVASMQLPSFRSALNGVNGAEDALPPHEAYSQLLGEWMPLLMDELDTCAEFLMLKADDPTNPTSTHTGSSRNVGSHGSSSPRHAHKPASASQRRWVRIVPGGAGPLAALLDGISADFLITADLSNRQQQQILAVPMLAATLEWQSKLGDTPMAAPLSAVLAQCRSRLLANFTKFITDTVAAVHRFEPRSSLTLSDGVKSVHVLPFVPNFGNMVARLEELHTATEAGRALLEQQGQDLEEEDEDLGDGSDDGFSGSDTSMHREVSLQVGAAAGRRGPFGNSEDLRRHLREGLKEGLKEGLSAGLQLARGMGLKAARLRHRQLDTVDSGDSEDEEAGDGNRSRAPLTLTDAEIPANIPEARHITSAREVIDAAYALLSRAVLKSVERIAAADAKHGDRLRLENYLVFTKMLAAFRGSNAVLHHFCGVAASSKSHALQGYVKQQLEYAKLWRVVDFANGIEQQSRDVGPEEVPFQPGFLPTDLRAMLASSFNGVEKRLTQLHARISKHVHGDVQVIDMVWRQLRSTLEAHYSQLSEQVRELYPSLQLPVTPEALRALLVALG